MGMHASMIYVDLLYDPALADDGLRKTEQHFQHIGSYTRRIPQPYSPTLQDVAMVAGLAQIPMNPEDWVIVADMDEFYTFGNSSSVQVAAQVMEQEGASFALGRVSYPQTTPCLADSTAYSLCQFKALCSSGRLARCKALYSSAK